MRADVSEVDGKGGKEDEVVIGFDSQNDEGS